MSNRLTLPAAGAAHAPRLTVWGLVQVCALVCVACGSGPEGGPGPVPEVGDGARDMDSAPTVEPTEVDGGTTLEDVALPPPPPPVDEDAGSPPPPPPSPDAEGGGTADVPAGDVGAPDANLADAAVPDAMVVVPMPDAAAEAPKPPKVAYDQVFDLARLHIIDIVVDPAHLETLNRDVDRVRVPATVTYDGIVLPQTGLRKKAYRGSLRDLFNKTGFSVDFHEYLPQQRLLGLKKITLNNSVQDDSFLHEHLAYEIYRRAATPAPLTAHGLVTFNGIPFGLYVIKETVDGEFLDRNFGGANDQGNLYEGPCCHDFVTSPQKIELKDEESEMRSRQDLLDLASLILNTPDAQWEAAVGAKLDLENFITSYALDAVTDHFDNMIWNGNNYYLYNHPGTGKFVVIPHGADRALWSFRDPFRAPESLLALKIRALPALDARFVAAIRRMLGQPFDIEALNARIDRAAATILAHTPTDLPTMADFQRLRDNLPVIKQQLVRRKQWAATLPPP